MSDLSLHTLRDGPRPLRAARFSVPGGAAEWHLCGSCPDLDAYHRALAKLGLSRDTAIFRRWFLADPGAAPEPGRAVGQAPIPGGGPALWAYHVDPGPAPGREHRWYQGCVAPVAGDVAAQTRALFQELTADLAHRGATLRDQLVRTWLYVADIDADYGAMVDARAAHFAAHGLTAETHFVASTGIGGRTADPRAAVQLDAYAVVGLDPGQLRQLEAPDHLGPTHDYGVTFERGTRVAYGDRAHAWISGTASIDPTGRTRHLGDVRAQLARAMDNVRALLQDAGATPADLVQALVYLRRPGDEEAIRGDLERALPGVPRLAVHGAVCRPEWLVEIECLAIVADTDARWPEF